MLKNCLICKIEIDGGKYGGKKHCNPCRTKVALARTNRKRHARRHRVLEFFGGKCVCCGEKDPLVLDIDHIKGDGNLRPKSERRGLINTVIKEKYPKDRYQLLCRNCNWAKHRLGNTMPQHRKEYACLFGMFCD